MAQMTATERAKLRLKQLHEQRRFSQTKVAARLNIVPSGVSKAINDPEREITVAFLEAVSEVANIPIAELIAPEGTLKQLDPDEAFILRTIRKWPVSVRGAVRTFLAYFADEEPVETQTRNLHEYWRQMALKDREWFYGVAVLMKEGSLPPDLRAGLVDRLERDRYAREADDAKRRRKA